jgi:hypothetical protein
LVRNLAAGEVLVSVSISLGLTFVISDIAGRGSGHKYTFIERVLLDNLVVGRHVVLFRVSRRRDR